MRTFIIIVSSIFIVCGVRAQIVGRDYKKKIDIGPFLGATYYIGEINKGKQFYSPQPAAGIMVRWPFTPRYAVRGSLIYGDLKGSDNDFASGYQGFRGGGINTPLVELSGLFELNYLTYIEGNDHFYYTPYVTAGITAFYAFNASKPLQVAIPFGVGFKYNVMKDLNISCEWTFRKTFTDGLDNLEGVKVEELFVKQTAEYYNKDWYTMAGITVTYKIRIKKKVCWQLEKL